MQTFESVLLSLLSIGTPAVVSCRKCRLISTSPATASKSAAVRHRNGTSARTS